MDPRCVDTIVRKRKEEEKLGKTKKDWRAGPSTYGGRGGETISTSTNGEREVRVCVYAIEEEKRSLQYKSC